MSDTELLDVSQRKEKIHKIVSDLNARFNELLWADPLKVERMKRYKPSVLEEFWEKWEELDARLADYLKGKIEWEGDVLQMEFMPITKVPYPVLEVDRDIANYSRDMYVWMAQQVQTLP